MLPLKSMKLNFEPLGRKFWSDSRATTRLKQKKWPIKINDNQKKLIWPTFSYDSFHFHIHIKLFSQPLKSGSCFMWQTHKQQTHTITTWLSKSVYKIPQKLFQLHDSHGFLVSFRRRLNARRKVINFISFQFLSLHSRLHHTTWKSLQNFTILLCCALWRLNWGNFCSIASVDLPNTKFVEFKDFRRAWIDQSIENDFRFYLCKYLDKSGGS